MKNFYILDACHAIDLDEVMAIEFCEAPLENGKRRIKIVFKGHGHTCWFDVSETNFNKLAFKIREDRIC